MRSTFRSALATLLAVSILALGPATQARAGAATTESLGTAALPVPAPDRAALARELVRLGVDPQEAQRRVDALSREEVGALQDRLDQLPAGGFFGELIAAGLIVFLVLLITDIAGLTDVFTFVKKPARR
jgi:hypothetical protein